MYTVNILLSTFNGELYISEQIESIMNQIGVRTILTIRDDGSSDNTIMEIKKMKKKYPKRIELLCGKNIGYKKSFLRLLGMAKRADYYGFSDQDDVWKTEKCIRAVEELEKMEQAVKLYASGVILTDENLNYIKQTSCNNVILSIPSVFIRQRLAGCTYIFSQNLKIIAESFMNMDYPENEMPSHDFVIYSSALAFGEVKVDSESYIYHRRHQNSITAGGCGIKKRIGIEIKNTFQIKNMRYHLANEFMEKYSSKLSLKDYKFLLLVSEYKEKSEVRQRLKLIFSKEFSCGLFVADVEARIKVLLGIF